ncbi:hypothetical protein PZA11_004436 [Diplocarpon coronariae]
MPRLAPLARKTIARATWASAPRDSRRASTQPPSRPTKTPAPASTWAPTACRRHAARRAGYPACAASDDAWVFGLLDPGRGRGGLLCSEQCTEDGLIVNR